jgi:hypothetical protein
MAVSPTLRSVCWIDWAGVILAATAMMVAVGRADVLAALPAWLVVVSSVAALLLPSPAAFLWTAALDTTLWCPRDLLARATDWDSMHLAAAMVRGGGVHVPGAGVDDDDEPLPARSHVPSAGRILVALAPISALVQAAVALVQAGAALLSAAVVATRGGGLCVGGALLAAWCGLLALLLVAVALATPVRLCVLACFLLGLRMAMVSAWTAEVLALSSMYGRPSSSDSAEQHQELQLQGGAAGHSVHGAAQAGVPLQPNAAPHPPPSGGSFRSLLLLLLQWGAPPDGGGGVAGVAALACGVDAPTSPDGNSWRQVAHGSVLRGALGDACSVCLSPLARAKLQLGDGDNGDGGGAGDAAAGTTDGVHLPLASRAGGGGGGAGGLAGLLGLLCTAAARAAASLAAPLAVWRGSAYPSRATVTVDLPALIAAKAGCDPTTPPATAACDSNSCNSCSSCSSYALLRCGHVLHEACAGRLTEAATRHPHLTVPLAPVWAPPVSPAHNGSGHAAWDAHPLPSSSGAIKCPVCRKPAAMVTLQVVDGSAAGAKGAGEAAAASSGVAAGGKM